MILKTGDILLFSETPTNCCMRCFDRVIQKWTMSIYSHSALVVVDPPWAPDCKGTFVWESTWHGVKDPQDGLRKFGVQLTPIHFYFKQYPGKVSIWVRKHTFKDVFTDEALTRLHAKVYRHPYDTRIKDWISAAFNYPIQRQTECFTCSAFVSFILTELNILNTNTCWTTVSAAQFSSKRQHLDWVKKYTREQFIGCFN